MQFVGVETRCTISSFSLSKKQRPPCVLPPRESRSASTPVKKYTSFGDQPTVVSLWRVGKSSNRFKGALTLRRSHTFSVPSSQRESSVRPSLPNESDVTSSPAGCAPLKR